jgi:hypothetical protein
MKLRAMLDTCVQAGMDHDPRGRKQLEKQLEEKKKEFESLDPKKKKFFDQERLKNPYHDTRILAGEDDHEVKVIYAGVDLDVPQILVADRLRERGEKIDCLFLHHPQGRADLELPNDMKLQIDLLKDAGVPETHVEHAIEQKIQDLKRTSDADNLFEWEKTAVLLDFTGLCCHTPADNLIWHYLSKHYCERKFVNIGALMEAILEEPEFEYYAKRGVPPMFVNCGPENRTGRIVATEITGGTTGPAALIEEQAKAGVGTILSMHVSQEINDAAKAHNMNVLQLPHYAADDLGLNLMFDLLQKMEPDLKIIDGCGYVRVKRNKK